MLPELSDKRPAAASLTAVQEVWISAHLTGFREAPRFAVNRALHWLVFASLRKMLGNAEAEALHGLPSKPFSISPPMRCDDGIRTVCLEKVRSGSHVVRVSFSEPFLALVFAAWINGVSGLAFPLPGFKGHLRVEKAEMGRLWTPASSQPPGSRRFRFEVKFLSPVIVKQGARACTEMAGGVLLRSMALRASRLGLSVSPEEADRLSAELVFSGDLSPVPYQVWEGWAPTGFLGTVRAEGEELASRDCEVLAALLDLAALLGLGAKTGFGAGYVACEIAAGKGGAADQNDGGAVPSNFFSAGSVCRADRLPVVSGAVGPG